MEMHVFSMQLDDRERRAERCCDQRKAAGDGLFKSLKSQFVGRVATENLGDMTMFSRMHLQMRCSGYVRSTVERITTDALLSAKHLLYLN